MAEFTKHDAMKLRPMMGALLEVSKVAEEGAKTHGGDPQNWVNCRDDEMWRYVEALYRHLVKRLNGEFFDEETAKLHLASVAWNALALLEFDLAARFPERPYDNDKAKMAVLKATKELTPDEPTGFGREVNHKRPGRCQYSGLCLDPSVELWLNTVNKQVQGWCNHHATEFKILWANKEHEAVWQYLSKAETKEVWQ